MLKYNDYELLYLVNEGIEEAMNILLTKYMPLIRTRIRNFKIIDRAKEDFFQEGLMTLYKAIRTYNAKYSKTFTMYFDLILQRRFIQILKKEEGYFKNEVLDNNVYETCYFEKRDVSFDQYEDKFSAFEKTIFNEIVVNGRKIKDIAGELNIDNKSIYNCMVRIRQKVKK